jgi:hypothetical protein
MYTSSIEALLLLGLRMPPVTLTCRRHPATTVSHRVYLILLILHICISLMTACCTFAAKKLEKASVHNTTSTAQVLISSQGQ